jgi:hypothetical protein
MFAIRGICRVDKVSKELNVIGFGRKRLDGRHIWQERKKRGRKGC